MTRAQLEKEQDARIRYLLNLAYEHSPFLHDLFDKVGVNPRKIKAGDGKKVLLDAYEKGLRTSPEDLVNGRLYADYVGSIHTTQVWTSGTSGRSKIVLYSPDDFARSDAQVGRLFNTVGIEPGIDGLVAFVAPFPFATAHLAASALRQVSTSSATFVLPPISPLMPEEDVKFRLEPLYDTMRKLARRLIVIGGTYGVDKLGRLLNKYGFDMNLLHVKAVCVGAEPTTLERRLRISQDWQKDKRNIFYDLYASSEASVMAFECPAHSGLHVAQPEIYLFAAKEGRPLGEGEEGYDVVTVLPQLGAKPGTFIINYSHSDLLRVIPGECECGLPYYRISHPRREVEQIRIAGFGLDVRDLERMVSQSPYTGEYLVIWQQPKGTELTHRLTIRLECTGQVTHAAEDIKRQLASSNPLAYDMFFTSGAVEVQVEIVPPGAAFAGYEKFVNPGKSTRLVQL